MATSPPSVSQWCKWLWEDLQPTPGRLASSVRVTLAVILALILLLVLQVPFINLALYLIFVVGRESPTVSLRSSMLSLVVSSAAVLVELIVVIGTDNDPLTRILSVAAMTFVAGALTQASNFAPLAPIFGLLYCTVIALWENQIPPDRIVKFSLYLIASEALALGAAVFVEYLFASRSAVKRLLEERAMRYRALETMFCAYANGAPPEELFAAYLPVARQALAGQRSMQELYQVIVQRNLNPKGLPIAMRIRITLLAELVDVSAAFGSAHRSAAAPELREHCAWIADCCRKQRENVGSQQIFLPKPNLEIAALQPVEETMEAIMAMPVHSGDCDDDEKLTVLPAHKIPFFVPGALNAKSTFTFGFKISFCATLCYILYHALDYPEISTAVTTVLVCGLTTTGAMKQKLAHRLAGAIIGGLLLGLGSIVFLFPHMDSITALCGLVGAVTFLAAWSASGRRFSYIGLQIAFSFFTVTLASSAPTGLAPARDRLVGIGLALLIMWFVFDQAWPLRTVTLMRQALASVLRSEARLFSLSRPDGESRYPLGQVDGLRNQVGKNIVELRSLKDTVLYEFGVDHEKHKAIAETIFQASMVSSALFWNELTLLERKQDQDLAGHPSLHAVRAHLANGLDAMAEAVDSRFPLAPLQGPLPDVSTLQPDARESVYAETLMSRYRDLHSLLTTFTRMFDHPIGSRIDIASPPSLQQKPSDVSLREDERNHYERS